MGVAVGDFNNDGFPDLLITCVGQNRLFRNTGKGTFVDVTRASGLGGRAAFSTSAMWVDFDRDGLLDLFVCNYVRWSAEHDVFCSLDGKQKSYCTPEAYRGETCWLFRNRGNGTFEDVTATCGIFDSSSKALGVAMLDDDQDGWPDMFVANDTQPNKLYRNLRNGTFTRRRARGGGGASAGTARRAPAWAWTPADFDNSGRLGLAITNFDSEMIGLYRPPDRASTGRGDARPASASPRATRSGSAACSPTLDLDGAPRSRGRQRPHRRDRPEHPRQRRLRAAAAALPQPGQRTFRDVAAAAGAGFAQPRVGRGLAFGDFDRDGDVDVLMTTNSGRAVSVPQRSDVRATGACGSASMGTQVQPRRHRRDRADLPRRHVADADGEERLELSVAVRAAGDVRRRPARPRRPRRHHVAERARPRSSGTSRRAAPTSASRGRDSRDAKRRRGVNPSVERFQPFETRCLAPSAYPRPLREIAVNSASLNARILA